MPAIKARRKTANEIKGGYGTGGGGGNGLPGGRGGATPNETVMRFQN
jgi:hypothetical protein